MKTIAPIAAFFRVRLRERGFKMAHQAIYRRWRPMVFEDIIGQGHITKTLKNQIIGGKVGHAYLFCGTRGTGKTTCAKVLSRAVNCLNPKDGSPCNECEICKGIIDGSIMDVKEIDAASNNGVDNIREIRDDVQYVSANTKYTVYIIDEVHMLSTGAFNALLKTLEEPPEHVIFILATTEAHKVPETIRSRCQRFDFRRIKPSDIIVRMKEIAHGDGLNITEDAYKMLGRLADGSMRDGLSILERVVSAEGNEVTAESITNVLGISTADSTFKITDAVLKGDAAGIVSVIDDVLSEGKDLKVFMDSLIKCFRDMMLCKVTDKTEAVLDLDPTDMIKLKSLAEKMTFE
ncbi:MAG: DNA polymerase III subunit gamma/tau, partial [Clostridia bacterium]|nr:DNA polymerase III subunit gamma/tau [Clostridia bacterium]